MKPVDSNCGVSRKHSVCLLTVLSEKASAIRFIAMQLKRTLLSLRIVSTLLLWVLFGAAAFAAPDFSVSVSPASVSVVQANVANYMLTLNSSGGFRESNILLRISGLPAGASTQDSYCWYNGGIAVSIQTSLTTPIGSYPLTFTCTSGSLVRSGTATLVVTAAPPYFTLAVSPASRLVTVGGSASYSLSVAGFNGFIGNVIFSTAGLPANSTASYSPVSITGSGSSTLTIATTASSPPGAYTITITGASGTLTKTAVVILYINGVGADYTLSANPPSETEVLNLVFCTTTEFAINVQGTNGFSEPVSFNVTNVPASMSATITPTSIAAATLRLCTYTVGTVTVTVTGTSMSGIIRSVSATSIVVSCLPSYQASVTPSSATVVRGGDANYTLNINGICGWAQTVTATASNLPAGATFVSGSVTGSGSAPLKIITSTSTPAGTYYPINIQLNGGSTAAALTLIVEAPSRRFTLSAAPSTLTVVQGATGNYAVTATFSQNVSGGITLSASSLPPYTTATFAPASLSGTGSSTLSLAATSNTPVGTYSIPITGSNSTGSEMNVTRITLVVQSPVSTISGRVTQSNGTTAISGATVSYFQNSARLGAVTANANGDYAIAGIAPGSYALFAAAPNYKTWIASTIAAPANGTATQLFPLPVLNPEPGIREYIRLGGRLAAIEKGAGNTRLLDFETYTGVNQGLVSLPAETIGNVTVSGGQIFPITTFLPANSTVVYLSGSFDWCPACIGTITLSFAQHVRSLSLFLMNGLTDPISYRVSDDQGGSQTFTIPANFNSGGAAISFAATNIGQITITTELASGYWDFCIDSVRYTIEGGSAFPSSVMVGAPNGPSPKINVSIKGNNQPRPSNPLPAGPRK